VNEIAPSARNVALVDFDNTIYPWAPIMSMPDPLPVAADALRRLHSAGIRIVIFTSRLSPLWLIDAGYSESEQREHIENLLKRDNIPYDEITAEKQVAEWYIDDRAIRFRDGEWPAIADWILWSRDG